MKERDRNIKGPQAHSDSTSPPAKAPLKNPALPWRVAAGGLITLLLIWFVIQNSHPVEVRLFWWTGAFPMIMVLAAVVVATILIRETLGSIRRRRRRRGRRKGG